MPKTLVFGAALSLLSLVKGFTSSRILKSANFAHKVPTQICLFDEKADVMSNPSIPARVMLSLPSLLATFFLCTSTAFAAEAAPISVFEDPAVAKQVVGGLVVGVAWIIPYFILNVIIAPKIGLIEEDSATELKNKTRDFF